jgi:hypothetical protein
MSKPPLYEQTLIAVVQRAEQAEAEVAALREQVAAVEKLHFARGRNILGRPVCNECSPLQPMPCPTLRALGFSGSQEGKPKREAATAASDMCPRCHGDNSDPWGLCSKCQETPEPTCKHGRTEPHLTPNGLAGVAGEMGSPYSCPGPLGGRQETGE